MLKCTNEQECSNWAIFCLVITFNIVTEIKQISY